MTTSAMNLYQMLANAAEASDQETKFLDAVTQHLGLAGVDAGAQVAGLIQTQISRIESDIERLPAEHPKRGHLKRYLSPFNGLKSLSHIHMDIKAAKSHFLKPENMLGLMNLHIALADHVDRPNLSNDAKELAEKFASIREEVVQSQLPESLKNVLFKRTNQICSILEHYYAFGAEALEEELESLIGALVVSAPANKSKAASLYTKLANCAVAALIILTAVDNGLQQTISINENTKKLLGIADGDSNQESD